MTVTWMNVLVGQAVTPDELGYTVESLDSGGWGSWLLDETGSPSPMGEGDYEASIDGSIKDGNIILDHPYEPDPECLFIGAKLKLARSSRTRDDGDVFLDVTPLTTSDQQQLEQRLREVEGHLRRRGLPHDKVGYFVCAVPKM